jgi:FkbM family methyltransferase
MTPARDFVADTIRAVSGAVAFDIGAYLGTYTDLLARRFDKVYAFEPDPRLHRLLKVAVAHCPNVEIVPLAVADRSGDCTMLLSDYEEANTLVEAMLPGPDWDLIERRPTPCTSIDDFCVSRGLQVDFIKMDIEGAEDFAWQGAVQTLARGVHIVLEVHRTVAADRLLDFFIARGYRCTGMDGSQDQMRVGDPFHEPQYYLRPR